MNNSNSMKITDIFYHWKQQSSHGFVTSADLQKYIARINEANLESEADITKFLERLDIEERGEGFVHESEFSQSDISKNGEQKDDDNLERESERVMQKEEGLTQEEKKEVETKNRELNKQPELNVSNEQQKRLSTEKHESLIIMKKLVLLKQMFKKVQEKTEADLVKVDPTLSGKISWTHTLSCGAGKSGITCVMPNKEGKDQSFFVNANVNELLRLPGECAFAQIYGKVQTVIMNSKQKRLANDFTSLVNDNVSVNDLDFGNDDITELIEGKREAIIKALTQHFSRIFPAEFSDLIQNGLYSAKGCNALARYAANAIASELSDEELQKFSKEFFNFARLEQMSNAFKNKDFEKTGITIAKEFLYGDLLTYSRMYELQGGQGKASKNDLLRDASLGVTSENEATELLKRYVDTAFMRKHQAKMMNPNKKKGEYTQEDIQAFCEEYVEKFTKAYNLTPIKLEYVSTGGDKGTYVDFGKTSVIRINVKKVENIVDLTATLSHELTHYVDSSRNKVAGKYNERNGGGLEHAVNDLDLIQMYNYYVERTKEENQKHPEKQEPIKSFKAYKHEYYMTNPDEVHAREKEAEILLFCKTLLLGGKDKDGPLVADELRPEFESIISNELNKLERENIETLRIVAGLSKEEAAKLWAQMKAGDVELSESTTDNAQKVTSATIEEPVVESGQPVVEDENTTTVLPEQEDSGVIFIHKKDISGEIAYPQRVVGNSSAAIQSLKLLGGTAAIFHRIEVEYDDEPEHEQTNEEYIEQSKIDKLTVGQIYDLVGEANYDSETALMAIRMLKREGESSGVRLKQSGGIYSLEISNEALERIKQQAEFESSSMQ